MMSTRFVLAITVWSYQGLPDFLMPSAERLRCLPHIIQKLGRMNFAKQASEKYSHIITGLYYGFHIGLPLINNTQSPPNKDSVVEFTGEFNRIVQNEIQKGCYLGPISR